MEIAASRALQQYDALKGYFLSEGVCTVYIMCVFLLAYSVIYCFSARVYIFIYAELLCDVLLVV